MTSQEISYSGVFLMKLGEAMHLHMLICHLRDYIYCPNTFLKVTFSKSEWPETAAARNLFGKRHIQGRDVRIYIVRHLYHSIFQDSGSISL